MYYKKKKQVNRAFFSVVSKRLCSTFFIYLICRPLFVTKKDSPASVVRVISHLALLIQNYAPKKSIVIEIFAHQ